MRTLPGINCGRRLRGGGNGREDGGAGGVGEAPPTTMSRYARYAADTTARPFHADVYLRARAAGAESLRSGFCGAPLDRVSQYRGAIATPHHAAHLG